MAHKHAPSPSQIAELKKRAGEYGYIVDDDGSIILKSGDASPCRIVNHRGGIRVIGYRNADSPVTLWTGTDLGKFLEAFWFAKPKAGAA